METPQNLQSDIVACIEAAETYLSQAIHTEWKPVPLEASCSLSFSMSGLYCRDVQIQSNHYAMLIVAFGMSNEWGWNFGDCLDALRDGSLILPMNNLNDVSEVFKILDSRCGSMTPKPDRESLTTSPLGDAIGDLIIGLLQEGVGTDVIPQEKVRIGIQYAELFPNYADWKQSNLAKDLFRVIDNIIVQLETGLTARGRAEKDAKSRETYAELLSLLNFGFVKVADRQDAFERTLLDTTDKLPRDLQPMCSVRPDGESTILTVYVEGDEATVQLRCKTPLAAISAFANMAIRMALLWKLSERMEPERAIEVIENAYHMPEEVQSIADAKDMSSSELSDSLISLQGDVQL
jgi:hypothetical protein